MNSQKWLVKNIFALSLFIAIGNVSAADSSKITSFGLSIEGIQQNKKISGVVKDLSGPIVGASVSVKGTSIGVITDIDGNFKLDVPNDGTIVVSFIGYTSREIPIKGKNEFIITLSEDVKAIDEVVVTGYITQKKTNLTGAISTIGGSELAKITTTSSAQTLQGKLPGVQITASNGAPGASTQIQVRGRGSVNSSTAPLVIVDGFEGSLDNIAMADIETISVLKDAASASIYGSKAANGVILITTKKGIQGKMKVEILAEYGLQSVSHMPKVLNATELAIKQNEEAKWSHKSPYWEGKNAPETLGKGFSWWNQAFKDNAPVQNYHVSMRGGSDKAKYAISTGYIDQKGIIPLTSYDRLNFRSNFDYTFNKKMKLGVNIEANVANSKGKDLYNYIKDALMMHPSVPQYMPDGSYGIPLRTLPGQYDTGQQMPLSIMYSQDPNYTLIRKNVHYQTRANLFLEWEIISGLVSKTVYNMHYGWTKSNSWSPSFTVYDYETPTSIYASQPEAESVSSYDDSKTWEVQQLFTYNKRIGDHSFGLFLGGTINEAKAQNLSGTKRGFPGNELTVIDAGNTIISLLGNKSRSAIVSFFGQLNYDYKGRYLFQTNVRRDGSSVFAPGNQWGTFPSLSAGWRISEENFMKGISWLNNLKVRIGYGTLGNAAIKQFAWVNSYSLIDRYPLGNPNIALPAYRLLNMTNENIKWETTTTTDIGLDASLLGSRLNFTFDWYDKRTTDMLFNATIPYSSGFVNGPVINIGEVMNRGWEASLSWNDKIKDFSYSISANFAHNKNEVTDMGGVAPFQTGTDLWIKEGYPVNSYFGYKVNGIYQNWDEVKQSIKPNGDVRPGMYIIENTNDDNIIDTKDKTYLGSRDPKYVYGINFSAQWKGLDLSIATSGESKKYIYYSNTYGGVNPKFMNIYKEYFDNRTIVGDDGNVAVAGKYPAMNGLWTNSPQGHGSVLQNTSYFRIKSIQFGYTLPKSLIRKMNLSDVRFYVNAVNPFLFTRYIGLDPETTSNELDGTVRYYPVSKTISLGISLKF